ncbi:MAG: glucose-1-phosphate adenylyltransferase [Ruminococcaceae bacterium]|nr:glucose-1-phosphate adenylyltransferase [Oscillospiraceae bacterium]
MYKKKECIAMLLAGGQGSRLFTLTEKTAKPAIPFGGKYRIIDFTLSNCINSGIDTVGVLTQYQPLVLNEYIGNGQPWDLDRTFGGVMVLPPYQKSKSADWYKGTANAIYQNLNFIERYDPDYVVILSGDHIYKMDYSAMLDHHKKMEADCTIAVLDVPLDQASRFGIMNCKDDGAIYEFEEKPAEPKSTKASMGIYIFNREVLSKYLIEDEEKSESSNDFGKNIIPSMLNDGKRLYAYEFSGYWKDVGTIPSLWEAHMDLLGENPVFNLYDSTRRIFSRSESRPPHYIGEGATITNSLISEGCEVHGTVENSVLFGGVYVAPGAVVRDSVIMSDTQILEGSEIYYSIIDSDTVIGKNVKLGAGQKNNKFKITLIGGELNINSDDKIPAGSMVNEAFLANQK